MNKYLNEIRKEVLNFQNEVENSKDEQIALDKKYKDGDISKNKYEETMKSVEVGNTNLDQIANKIDEIKNNYHEDLTEWAVLDPSDITDDVKLFELPVKFEMEMLTKLAENNQFNYTMLKSIQDFAEEKDVFYNPQYSIDKEFKQEAFDDFVGIAKNIINHARHNKTANYLGEMWKHEDKFNNLYADLDKTIQTGGN